MSLSVAHGQALTMLIAHAAVCQDGVGESLMSSSWEPHDRVRESVVVELARV